MFGRLVIRWFIGFLFIFIFSSEIIAQYGTIQGTLVDAETGFSVIGANVILQGTKVGAATDLQGNFLINNISPGIYSISITTLDFRQKIIHDIMISAGETYLLKEIRIWPKASYSIRLEADLLKHIAFLANDTRDGRGIGTFGLIQSANYIGMNFRTSGLTPLFGDEYVQRFEMNWGIEILKLNYLASGNDTLKVGEEIQPLGFTGIGKITSPVVFVGYGITATEYNYDDYEKIDAEGKIVIVMEGEPASDNPESRFEGKMVTQYAVLRNKAINAKVHGAAGIIIVKGPVTDPDNMNELPELRKKEPYINVGIPAMFVTNRGIKRILPDLNLSNAQRSIDINEMPRSMPVGKEPVTLTVDVNRSKVPVMNVGAKIEGDERVIVIGAHYDHLGYGQEGSTEPGSKEVHNGADDNASGVAVMLELAKRFADNGTPGPTLWFVAFTGEEVGLVGSSHFVNNPPEPLDNVIFMLNLDMIGRMQDNKLTGLGVNSAIGLREVANKAVPTIPIDAFPPVYAIDLTLAGDGYGPSDQMSFYPLGIPVLHLFTSPHFDYHSPRDDTDMINGKGLGLVFTYCLNLIKEISDEKTELVWQQKAPPERKQSEGSGKRPSLGTIPDFAQQDSIRGVRIQGVRPGSSADNAGLQGGDILVKMEKIIIDNIYDFVFALDSYKPGDKVAIEYKRDGEVIQTEAILGKPSSRGGPKK
ncbi:MAG: M20/M25/M40 family metallo-hydrolase [Candidatus Electryonea clarkiae]|nr:M20/M25/M40 family metallo-hydrolase [Candidatus Electryonea clarkiae]MDP8286044.1 M20/M25/M40 family metallo-hydrolase [Candidatus Electryonea clarkiae]